jgi:hypothetical protein
MQRTGASHHLGGRNALPIEHDHLASGGQVNPILAVDGHASGFGPGREEAADLLIMEPLGIDLR